MLKERYRHDTSYLITGFLGAGKTAFLKELITLFRNKRLALIINEFGKESIGGVFFKDKGAALQKFPMARFFVPANLTSLSRF